MTGQRFRASTFVIVGIASLTFGGIVTAAAIPLQLKLPKGKTYYQRVLIDQKITQSVMNQEQVVNISMGVGTKMDVLDVDAQGNMQIRNTFNWCAFKQAGPMGNVEYDSAKQATPVAGAEPFAALIGQSYTIKLSAKGAVLDVNGVDELREAVRKKLPPGAESSPAMGALSAFMDKRGIKEMTESNLAVYPDKPVEVGESWSKKKIITLGFSLMTDTKWTLQKREAGVATIGMISAVRTDPNAPPVEASNMKMKFDMAGSGEATIRMAEATGLIVADQGKQLLKGELKVLNPADGTVAMAIPSVFDTTTKVETGEKPWGPDAR
jgi:hypothetical protein